MLFFVRWTALHFDELFAKGSQQQWPEWLQCGDVVLAQVGGRVTFVFVMEITNRYVAGQICTPVEVYEDDSDEDEDDEGCLKVYVNGETIQIYDPSSFSASQKMKIRTVPIPESQESPDGCLSQ